ncbi:MAG: NUDIX domain-containing protein [Anaerolineales bacterium]
MSFLFSIDDGKMLIQKEAPTAPLLPPCWIAPRLEHIKAGESYLEAAIRGMKEEMGVEGI